MQDNPLRKRLGSEFFRVLPEVSGIYFMLDQRGQILYIGKAKNLKRRITSYSHLKAQLAPDHTLEMIEAVRAIEWIECASEQDALHRENQLLHAVRPPFNIAQTEPSNYLFIGIKLGKKRGNTCLGSGLIRLEFQLSRHDRIRSEGYQLYGCYKYRKKTKAGYAALLRLIYASTFRGKRYSCPSRIARRSPPWLYSIDFPEEWKLPLDQFLMGRSKKLLHFVLEKLLENEDIPGFVRASIQDDIEIVRDFFEQCSSDIHDLKRRYGIKDQIMSQDRLDELIAAESSLHRVRDSEENSDSDPSYFFLNGRVEIR